MNERDLYLMLSAGFRPFSQEAAFLEQIRLITQSFVDEAWRDEFGSLILHKKGTGRRIMLAAQADVPGVVITYTEKANTYRFLMTGKESPRIGENTPIKFAGEVSGSVVYDQGCTSDRDLTHMYIVTEHGELPVGSKGILCECASSDANSIRGTYAPEAAACIVLLNLIRGYSAEEADVYFVFSVGSESDMVSQRGVLCAAQNLEPDVGVSIEYIPANGGSVQAGKGAVILLSDGHAVLRGDVLSCLRKIEAQTSAAVQYAVLPETRRETALHHLQCMGAAGFTVAIPFMEQQFYNASVMLSDIRQCTQFLGGCVKTVFI